MKTKTCDYCGKTHNRKRFCSNKCKDKYHNTVNPRGYFAYLKSYDYTDNEADWDGHKESF